MVLFTTCQSATLNHVCSLCITTSHSVTIMTSFSMPHIWCAQFRISVIMAFLTKVYLLHVLSKDTLHLKTPLYNCIIKHFQLFIHQSTVFVGPPFLEPFWVMPAVILKGPLRCHPKRVMFTIMPKGQVSIPKKVEFLSSFAVL